MKIIDTHCDTVSCLLDNGGSLYDNALHVDIQRMSVYEHYTQMFAAFIDPAYDASPKQRCMSIIHKLHDEIEQNEDRIMLCRNAQDYEKASAQHRIGAFLSIEGGECITDLADIEQYYQMGVRCIALTWNHTNHIASGVMDRAPAYGLTAFGKEIVQKMNELGMLIDVSHLHEKAFWDVVRYTKRPVIATHSNARAVCAHPRNLTDEQFRTIVQMGGYVGLNFYPPFLKGTNAGIEDIVRHAAHFIEMGGETCIGFGADFDGVSALPEGVRGCQDYGRVEEVFLHYGFGQTVISNIQYGNFERILHENL